MGRFNVKKPNHKQSVLIMFATIIGISIMAYITREKCTSYMKDVLQHDWLIIGLYIYYIAVVVVHFTFCAIKNIKSDYLHIRTSFGNFFDYILNWCTMIAIGTTGFNLLKGIALQWITKGLIMYFPKFGDLDIFVMLAASLALFVFSITVSIRMFKEVYFLQQSVEPEKI